MPGAAPLGAAALWAAAQWAVRGPAVQALQALLAVWSLGATAGSRWRAHSFLLSHHSQQ